MAGHGFINSWIGVFSNISQIRPIDAAMGFACIGILLFLRVRFKNCVPLVSFHTTNFFLETQGPSMAGGSRS